MKFAHLADCHIGSWRDPKLKDASTEAFVRAIDISLQNKVDFILISGDLFNTPLPAMDSLKKTVSKMKEANDAGIPIYLIAGSHDYSPSGKTMLDVLESAGLVHNVMKGSIENGNLKLNFTVDKKTGAKITGLFGKRLGLEKTYYEHLARENLENEPGYKIFLFHSGIDELKSRQMEHIISSPVSLLPKNFNYYAGGHVHEKSISKLEGYGTISYPGPLFPNSFREIEDFGRGGFFIVEDGIPSFHPIQVYNTFSMQLDCTHKSPQQVQQEIIEKIIKHEFNNTIITIRLSGTLESGNPSDIDFREIYDLLYGKSAHFVMKNTSALVAKEYEELSISTASIEDIEGALIREHLGQIKLDGMSKEDEFELIKMLMEALGETKAEGERNLDFEERMKKKAGQILHLD